MVGGEMSLGTFYQGLGLVAVFATGVIAGMTGLLVWFGKAIKRATRAAEAKASPADEPASPSPTVPTVPPAPRYPW